MSANKPKRLPKGARQRYAQVLLRYVYQHGGRERYIPLEEIENALGLEQWMAFRLCRKHLRGEVHIAHRPPADLEEGEGYRSALERQLIRDCFAKPHVRIRSDAVRFTEEELLRTRKRRKKDRKKKRK
ncbi:MAG: hypothetical protein ACYTGN_12700 [Planctomycetota bacterium]|jgi:hypothetical protein